jgi:membrane protein implicated in regulation of membrane protease activity
MPYLHYSRLNFCYQLFAFLSILGMGAFAIAAITTSLVLYGWVTALFVLLAVVSIKRARMYQTKMDNFDYKYYLDNE